MARKSDPIAATRKAVIAAAMTLAAERGWRRLSLGEIAEAAGRPLSALYPDLASKGAILAALSAETDRAMLAEEDPDAAEESRRDRLFDLLMRRFDALTPHRPGLLRVARDLGRDPVAALGAAPGLARSMALTLEAAGLAGDGLLGGLRVKALGLAYLAAFRVWLGDESADLARTMAALDRHLRRLEALAERIGRRPAVSD